MRKTKQNMSKKGEKINWVTAACPLWIQIYSIQSHFILTTGFGAFTGAQFRPHHFFVPKANPVEKHGCLLSDDGSLLAWWYSNIHLWEFFSIFTYNNNYLCISKMYLPHLSVPLPLRPTRWHSEAHQWATAREPSQWAKPASVFIWASDFNLI